MRTSGSGREVAEQPRAASRPVPRQSVNSHHSRSRSRAGLSAAATMNQAILRRWIRRQVIAPDSASSRSFEANLPRTTAGASPAQDHSGVGRRRILLSVTVCNAKPRREHLPGLRGDSLPACDPSANDDRPCDADFADTAVCGAHPREVDAARWPLDTPRTIHPKRVDVRGNDATRGDRCGRCPRVPPMATLVPM